MGGKITLSKTLEFATHKRHHLSVEISGPSGTLISFASAKSPPKTTQHIAKKGSKLYPGLLYHPFGKGVSTVKISCSESSGSDSSNKPGSNNTRGGRTESYVGGCLTEKDIEKISTSILPAWHILPLQLHLQPVCHPCPSPTAVSTSVSSNAKISTQATTASSAVSAFIQ
jgi:hypothetical protein